MFIETAIAMFLLGLIVGAWIVQLLRADGLHAENMALKQQQANRSWEREREAIQYQAFVNTHRGTPYLQDDHNGSRKAPELRSVS